MGSVTVMAPATRQAQTPEAAAQPAVIPIRRSTLFDLTDTLDQLFGLLEEAEEAPEGVEIDAAAVHAEIARAIQEHAAKVDGIAGYIRHLAKQCEFAKEEVERLRTRRDRFERRAERIKDMVLAVMEAFDQKKIEGKTSTFTRQKNAPSVVITDATALPEAFLRVKTIVEPDKVALKSALQHDAVPGAALDDTKWSLRIR